MKGAFGVGDAWTWVAIDADTKLVPSWAVGRRDAFTDNTFVLDVDDRLATRVQLTTDGHKPYLEAVEGAFRQRDRLPDARRNLRGRIRQARLGGAAVQPGNVHRRSASEDHRPDERHISTSFAERQNLTMLMSMRRFTRLTDAFSKKLDNRHRWRFTSCGDNFARIHQPLRVTPAMKAGISDHVWSAEEIAILAG